MVTFLKPMIVTPQKSHKKKAIKLKIYNRSVSDWAVPFVFFSYK